MKAAARRLLEEQIAVVVVLESGRKDDGMCHMTFDSNMTFEKHLRSVSRAASQRLGILEVLASVP